MILRRLFALILFNLTFISAQDFRCNELVGTEHKNLQTFEFVNPKTRSRGVACASFLNDRETLLIYLEEEMTGSKTNNKNLRKQAVGRAQRQSSAPSSHLYTGVIHVTTNIQDDSEDLFDLDGAAFTLSISTQNNLGTFSIKSRNDSIGNIVYIWQPRSSVPKWIMQVDIPEKCGSKSYSIHDPIPGPSKDRKGIVCILEESAGVIKFFSLGWRKAGVSGKPRKFINFGSLRAVSPHYLNIYSGRIHSFNFPCSCEQKDLLSDRQNYQESLIITAVRSINVNSLMIYGDIQEEWHNTQTQIDRASMPRYPLLPIDLKSDYSGDLSGIYGLPNYKK